MSQQIQINYGAAPNDGTGDPLRTAFIKTDENFDNIWLAGPVGSNVTIANNTISVTNTNGNLILSPNGIGAIQTNSRLTPLANLTYDIGSQSLRYRNVYASGIDVANAVLGNLSNINITVANLHVLGGSDGYVLQTDGTGNLTWVASTGVPGGANTQVQFNNAGSFGAQTGFTFDKTSNLLSVPGNITTTGNITGNYFLGNGSQLTGIAASYGNANVVANLAALGTNPITTTGNITGNYFLGNGSQLTGIVSSYGNANVVANLAALGTNPITTTGNITGNYFLGNGSQLTGIAATYSNSNVTTLLASLGSNIISGTGNITTTGNISGSYILGNGSQLTGIAASYGNANVVANLAALGTNPITTTGNITAGNLITSGLLSVTGNITGNYFIGNGSQLTGISTSLPLSNGTSNINIATANGNVTVTSAGNTWTFDTDRKLTVPAATGVPGSISAQTAANGRGYDLRISAGNTNGCSIAGGDMYLSAGAGYGGVAWNAGNVNIVTGDRYSNPTGNTWRFDALGNLTFPTGNLVIIPDDPAGNIASIASTDHPLGILSTGANGAVSSLWVEDIGNVSTSNIAAVYANPTPGSKIVRIAVGENGSPGPNLWDFNANGTLTLPNGATIQDTVGNALAFGLDAGATGPQGNAAVAIGQQAGETSQGLNAVAIGALAGTNTQNANTVAIGREAGQTTQQAGAVAVGLNAGTYIQGQNAVAIGSRAGNASQQTQSVAIGVDAAADSQGLNSVAIGPSAAAGSQGQKAVAIGLYAGNTTQGNSSVAIGDNAGFASQGIQAVAIGRTAGESTQGADAVAIGYGAGYQGQGLQAVAIGGSAGAVSQGVYAIAIGAAAGAAGNSAVAVGSSAGYSNQGNFAVAIGKSAGATNQGNNSIILNATGSALDQTTANTFTVAPVRNDVANVTQVMFYNTTSKEITYGNTISIAGNITSAYLFGNGSQLTGITASVPSQTILPTIQDITVVARPAGLFGGGQGGANVTVANTIPVTEYGVIITDGTTSEKYKTGSLGSIPGTVSLTFTTGLNSTQFTVFAYVTSNAGTYYSGSATGTSGICLLAGTQIALSDGTRKAIEDITYTDKMLSWDFDRGCYAETTAVWIKRGETGSQYNLLTFSDGTTLRTFDQHRIFNKQAGAFTYPMTAATPIGTVTVNEHGQEITLTNKQVIVDTIEYYNVITDYHMNLFSDSILTSCRFNNIYPITDMKFVKDSRTLRTRAEFENVEDRFFYGLRLAEQTSELSMIEWYVNRLLSSEVATQPELAV